MPYSESLADLIACASCKQGKSTELEIHYDGDKNNIVGCLLEAWQVDKQKTRIVVSIAIIVRTIRVESLLNEWLNRRRPRHSRPIRTLEIDTKTGKILTDTQGKVGQIIENIGDLFSPLRSPR